MKKVIISIIVVLVIVTAVIGYIVYQKINENRSKITTSSSLSKMLDVSDLETVDYTYNSVVTKMDGDKVAYHARYEGKVTAGIDFSAVTFDIDDEAKVIRVRMPAAKIQTVSARPVDYMFMKSKYETETVYAEINSLCNDDLKSKAHSDETIIRRANENSKNVIEGLIKPLTEGYTVKYEIVGGEE
ncbi:MAG: DUF4230 domain-containing protein [Lachnospiraceae bacterium]|nr:DUF4230 domain-containing protein [Lachnospiraceae bacterium]